MKSHIESRDNGVGTVGASKNPASRDDVHVLREGTTAGVLAATGVALWYLIRDLMAGHALYTPLLLGQGVGQLVGVQTMSATAAVLGFTAIHVIGFVTLGVVAAAIVRMARRNATVLAGAFLLFVVAEMTFYVAIGLLNQGTVDGVLGWSQLAAGNIIGCGLLGLTLLRNHPELPNEFRLAMNGTGTWSVQE